MGAVFVWSGSILDESHVTLVNILSNVEEQDDQNLNQWQFL